MWYSEECFSGQSLCCLFLLIANNQETFSSSGTKWVSCLQIWSKFASVGIIINTDFSAKSPSSHYCHFILLYVEWSHTTPLCLPHIVFFLPLSQHFLPLMNPQCAWKKSSIFVGFLVLQKQLDDHANPQAVGGSQQWEIWDSLARCRQLNKIWTFSKAATRGTAGAKIRMW